MSMTPTRSDRDDMTNTLTRLAALLQSRADQTVERVGIDFANIEVLPVLDSSESEDYGYWLAMEEAAALLRAEAVKALP